MKIFITGGTSGIGLALAKYFLNQGDTVGICGRDKNKVPRDLLENKNLTVYQVDVRDKENLTKSIDDFSKEGLDYCIASAGIYHLTRGQTLESEKIQEMIDVNINGTTNAFMAAQKYLIQNKSGKLLAISSIAGLFSNSLYANSKGAIIKICDAYRTALSPHGVDVQVIIPGYVNTKKLQDLNNGDLKGKPFVISVDKAVEIIIEGMKQNKKQIVFPWQMHLLAKFLLCLPKAIRFYILENRK